jgi:threonine dehydrogenase-like Zn-dependent dehydrogenase
MRAVVFRGKGQIGVEEMIFQRRVDLSPLVTHRFALDNLAEAFELFSHQRDGVLKVALCPEVAALRRAEAEVRAVQPA